MPTYEYACQECGKVFSEKMTFEEHERRRRRKCPKCGSRKVQQTPSAVFVKTSKKS